MAPPKKARKTTARAADRPAAAAERNARLPLGASAYERMRQAIQSGEYGPGDRVMEDEVAAKFGISRTPVREALRRLEDEGILVHESRRGLTVARLDYQMIMELYSMRYVLEGAAASMAARNATDIEVQALEALLAKDAAAAATPETMAEHNRRFHLAIYQCSHNRYLLKTLSVLGYSLALLSKSAFATPERREGARAEHRDIFEAIRARDSERAQAAAQRHMREAQVARMSILGVLDDGTS